MPLLMTTHDSIPSVFMEYFDFFPVQVVPFGDQKHPKMDPICHRHQLILWDVRQGGLEDVCCLGI